jgi:hypothetical protein
MARFDFGNETNVVTTPLANNCPLQRLIHGDHLDSEVQRDETDEMSCCPR